MTTPSSGVAASHRDPGGETEVELRARSRGRYEVPRTSGEATREHERGSQRRLALSVSRSFSLRLPLHFPSSPLGPSPFSGPGAES